jgi:plasmid maintenance system antidote protein VapI
MNQRLSLFIQYMGMTITQFSHEIETSQSAMSSMICGHRPISDKTVSKIKRTFPQLNVIWLRTGDGYMIDTSTTEKVQLPMGIEGTCVTRHSFSLKSKTAVNAVMENMQAEINRLNGIVSDREKKIRELETENSGLRTHNTELSKMVKLLTGISK